MFDLKIIHSVLDQLEEERGIPKEKVIEAIEMALATAYKREYGKRGQIIKAEFNNETGEVEFQQVKIVVDPEEVRYEEEEEEEGENVKSNEVGSPSAIAPKEEVENDPQAGGEEKVRFNPEHHIFIQDAQKIKKDAELGEEIVFPLENKSDYGRIAAQTAKQVIIQKIREAEKISIFSEYGQREGEIVTGSVQRVERGSIFIDLGRAPGIMPYDEQIPGERYQQGERIRAYLYSVEETPRGVFLRLSRSHPQFLAKLFEAEAPEIASGTVVIKGVAREAGSRSKVAVHSSDPHIDPVGSMVGQRGIRVSTVTSELSGEKIDIIEWSDDAIKFVEDSLSPAEVISVEIDEDEHKAIVEVSEDQQSLAIGRGGQNVRLAAKLTGWKIDIRSVKGESLNEEEDSENSDSPEKEEEGAPSDDVEEESTPPTDKEEKKDDDQTKDIPKDEVA